MDERTGSLLSDIPETRFSGKFKQVKNFTVFCLSNPHKISRDPLTGNDPHRILEALEDYKTIIYGYFLASPTKENGKELAHALDLTLEDVDDALEARFVKTLPSNEAIIFREMVNKTISMKDSSVQGE